MFQKFDEAASDTLAASRHECLRLRCTEVLPEHLLLALTRDHDNIAARVLTSMNITTESVQQELEQATLSKGKTDSDVSSGLSGIPAYENIFFGEQAKQVFEKANDFSLYLGANRVSPEHILLAVLDLSPEGAIKILEDLGANITFLRRQIMMYIAHFDSMNTHPPALRSTVLSGVCEIINRHLEAIHHLQCLAASTETRLSKLPERSEIVLMVFLAYLPDFLMTQVAYQRYLLEETLKLLHSRTGSIDKEITSTVVSQTAQNLRSEVRSIIDQLWSQEYRLLNHVPDEAEHEEIGTVIEELWWTYSEEIALHDVFDEALDDYRRKQVLDLQKRKLEISQRIGKIKLRLDDTLKQTFQRRTLA